MGVSPLSEKARKCIERVWRTTRDLIETAEYAWEVWAQSKFKLDEEEIIELLRKLDPEEFEEIKDYIYELFGVEE